MNRTDLLVVGGGIGGLATARAALRAHPGCSVTVVEKDPTQRVHRAPKGLRVLLVEADEKNRDEIVKDLDGGNSIVVEEDGPAGRRALDEALAQGGGFDVCLVAVERLAAFLDSLAVRDGAVAGESHVLSRSLTMETVAARLGTVREELSRTLGALERDGALELRRGTITILDLDELASIGEV